MTSPMMMSGVFIPLHVDAKHLTCNCFTHPQHMGVTTVVALIIWALSH